MQGDAKPQFGLLQLARVNADLLLSAAAVTAALFLAAFLATALAEFFGGAAPL